MAERSDRFFAWVWRLNGLFLLVLVLAGAVAMIAMICDALFSSRDRPQQQLTEVAGADLDAKRLRLRDFERIAGTRILYAELAEPAGYKASYGNTRNLLFFDMTTNKAHWLLPDNDQIIAWFSFLTDPPGGSYDSSERQERDREPVTLAMLIELWSPQAAAAADVRSRSLVVASADGRDLTPIAEPVGEMLGHHQPSPDSTLVFYVSDGAARVLDLDPIARKVRSDLLVSAEE